jgi:hypothetical protein
VNLSARLKLAHIGRQVFDISISHLLDLWTEMQRQKDWNHFLEDGLHLSKLGSEFLAQLLFKTLGMKFFCFVSSWISTYFIR